MRGWVVLLSLAWTIVWNCTVLVEPALAQQEPTTVDEPLENLSEVAPDDAELFVTPKTLEEALDQAAEVDQVSYESGCTTGCSKEKPGTYAQVDYLLWSLPGVDTPRLLTSNPAGTPLSGIANASDPTTQTLLGGSELGDWAHSGVRFRFGRIVSDGRLSRWELSGWSLFERSDSGLFESSEGDPILARPFTNATTGLPDAQVLSLAGFADGSLRSEYDRSLFGIEPLAFFCLSGNGCASLEAFTGYRYLHYEDELRLIERVRPQASGLIAPGSELLVEDTFSATNDYHLLPLGLHYVRRSEGWRVSARASVSLGFVNQEVAIHGRTTSSVGGVVDSVDTGGLLALASNSGSHDRTEFAFVPEINLQLHRALGKGVWANVGYTLLYLNEVVRAPAHIDTTIDPNQLPPATGAGVRPAFAWNSGGELLHGLNAGLEWHY